MPAKLKPAERLRRRKAFIADALAAEEEVKRTGLVYSAEDVHRYIRARIAGKKVRRPKLIKISSR